MPLYEYRCSKCGKTYEKIQKFSDKPRARCPECGGSGKRLISAPAIRFKGTGWYVTDYAGKGKSPDAAEKKDRAAEKAPASKTAKESKSKKKS